MRRDRAPFDGRAGIKTLVVVMVIMAYLIVACGGGTPGDAYPAPGVGDGSDLPPAGQAGGATLTCSRECADRGQCGESTDRGRVVLLSAAQPALSPVDFNLAIPDGTNVSVLETRSVDVVESASGFQFPVNFYRVLVPARNVEGWVASWCLLNPIS